MTIEMQRVVSFDGGQTFGGYLYPYGIYGLPRAMLEDFVRKACKALGWSIVEEATAADDSGLVDDVGLDD